MTSSNRADGKARSKEYELSFDELRRLRDAVLRCLGQGRPLSYQSAAAESDLCSEPVQQAFPTIETLSMWAADQHLDEVIRMVRDRQDLLVDADYEHRRTLAINVVGDAWLACRGIADLLDDSQRSRLNGVLAEALRRIFERELDLLPERRSEAAESLIKDLTSFASSCDPRAEPASDALNRVFDRC